MFDLTRKGKNQSGGGGSAFDVDTTSTVPISTYTTYTTNGKTNGTESVTASGTRGGNNNPKTSIGIKNLNKSIINGGSRRKGKTNRRKSKRRILSRKKSKHARKKHSKSTKLRRRRNHSRKSKKHRHIRMKGGSKTLDFTDFKPDAKSLKSAMPNPNSKYYSVGHDAGNGGLLANPAPFMSKNACPL